MKLYPKFSALLILTLAFFYFVTQLWSQSVYAATDDWPTYLHDYQRTSASTDTTITAANAAQLAKLWSFKTGGVIAASPIVSGGIVYVGSWDGYEYALDGQTGALKWKTFLGITTADPNCIPPKLGISSTGAFQNGVLYVGGGDSFWYALNATNGNVLWKVFTGDNSAAGGHYNWSSALLYNGFAYVGIASEGDCPLVQGQLLKINLTTHQIEKTLNIVPNGQIGGGLWTSVAIDPATNTIFATTGTENRTDQNWAQAVLAIDATNLTVKDSWKLPQPEAVLDSDFSTSPTLFSDQNGRPLMVSINKNGDAYAFNRTFLSAGPVWQQPIAVGGECPTCGQSSVSSGAFGQGRVYLAGGTTTINSIGYQGSVQAFNPATGAVLWQKGTPGTVIGALLYVNGLVADGAGSYFEVRNASNGARLYSYQVGGGIYNSPTVAQGIFYTGDLFGNVYAFKKAVVPPPPSDPNCPASWICQDIGNPNPTGSESVTGGVWTVQSSGAGVTGTSDQFRYHYKSANSDLAISTQLTQQPTGSANAQSGVMVRQNSDATSPYYAAFINNNKQVVIQYRTAFGGTTTNLNISAITLPKYLKIVRTGDTFQAASSSDGTSYTLVPGTTISVPMPAKVLAGLFASSFVNGTSSTSVFKNVTLGAVGTMPASPSSAHPCPTSWSCQDIGNPLVVGDQTLTGSVYSLTGAGGDIWESSDQFHYVWKNLAGNGTLSARVVSETNTDPWIKAGIMFRQNTSPAAGYYGAYMTPGNGLVVQYRKSNGFVSAQSATLPQGTLPKYLQLARVGTTFTAYTSTDGVSWTPITGSTVELPALSGQLLQGLVVNSHNVTSAATATFDQVAFSSNPPPPPNICPTGWNCADIGFPTPAGGQTLTSGIWSIQAGGGDIWDPTDSFRYISQNLTADGSISGRVTSLTNTSDWAKSGLMIRATTNSASAYYGVFMTQGHGPIIQYRTAQGGLSQQINFTGTLPIYFKIGRSGTTFTTYTSSDGTNWNPVAGTQITLANLSGPALAGMAVVSHNTAALTTSAIDSVTIAQGGGSGCPSGFTCDDIGGPSLQGSTSFAANTYTVKGGGNDIWQTTDQLHYASQTLNGDGEIIAQVTSQSNTDPWAKSGIMIKESRTAGANYAMLAVTPGNGLHMQYNFTGDQSGGTYTFPTWLKLKRVGNTFTSYKSTDGTNWIQVGSTTLTMQNNVTAGLFVCSHNATTLNTTTFTNFSLIQGSSTLPAPWINTDVGSPTLAGSSTYTSGTFSLKGAGSDIWGTTDQFQYAYQPLTGDGTIIARVKSQTGTEGWAKSGIMIKSSTTANSPYALVAITPGNGIHFQYNFTGDIAGGSFTLPNAWLKLIRVGNTLTASSSADGVAWTTIGSASVTIPTNATIGLFVNSHYNLSYSSSDFDNVSVTP